MGVSEVDQGALEAGFSSAKKQILLTLKREGSVSLGDLARDLGLSKMATLKHLNVLLLEQRAQEVLDVNRRRVPEAGLREKVSALAKIRDEGGYMAEMGRTRKNTVEMLEHNCPIM